ncbi:MAG TPA: DUF1707 domain-containing protein [Propionibacteriaceae bacterium]|nr:DUF1707 domain-containing protein [Propionibacteriaceae bacterium]
MTSGYLRASDRDRDQVADVLHAAYAEGKLDLEEHAERTTAALNARTFDELAALTSDLVPTPPTALRPVPAPVPAVYDGEEPDRVTAMLAESKRTGSWPVRRITQANVFMGSVTLDLTEATFATQEIVVNCTQLLGQITIRVPLGTTVRIEAANVLGDSSVKHVGEPDRAMPIVVVKGTNILGEISIRGPKKPSVWRRHVA